MAHVLTPYPQRLAREIRDRIVFDKLCQCGLVEFNGHEPELVERLAKQLGDAHAKAMGGKAYLYEQLDAGSKDVYRRMAGIVVRWPRLFWTDNADQVIGDLLAERAGDLWLHLDPQPPMRIGRGGDGLAVGAEVAAAEARSLHDKSNSALAAAVDCTDTLRAVVKVSKQTRDMLVAGYLLLAGVCIIAGAWIYFNWH